MNSDIPITYPGIETRILTIRGQRVMVDADLASLYGVTTKALNQAVKRNAKRFPPNFCFQLQEFEKEEVVTNCDHLSNLRFSHVLPYVFTEKGVLMLANVLKSDRAVDVSIQIIEAFVRLRSTLLASPDLAAKVAEIEGRLAGFQTELDIFKSLVLPLLEVNQSGKRKIGFRKND